MTDRGESPTVREWIAEETSPEHNPWCERKRRKYATEACYCQNQHDPRQGERRMMICLMNALKRSIERGEDQERRILRDRRFVEVQGV